MLQTNNPREESEFQLSKHPPILSATVDTRLPQHEL